MNQETNQQAAYQAQMEVRQNLQREFFSLTHAVFKQNPDGAKWLEQMKQNFLIKQQCAHPDKSESHAFFREGENSVIRLILHSIEQCELLASMQAKENKE